MSNRQPRRLLLLASCTKAHAPSWRERPITTRAWTGSAPPQRLEAEACVSRASLVGEAEKPKPRKGVGGHRALGAVTPSGGDEQRPPRVRFKCMGPLPPSLPFPSLLVFANGMPASSSSSSSLVSKPTRLSDPLPLVLVLAPSLALPRPTHPPPSLPSLSTQSNPQKTPIPQSHPPTHTLTPSPPTQPPLPTHPPTLPCPSNPPPPPPWVAGTALREPPHPTQNRQTTLSLHSPTHQPHAHPQTKATPPQIHPRPS